jgi:cell division septation protein DedD
MYDELEEEYPPQTEIHLSNSKLLLIFLGAAVVCGCCFGFGYSFGKHASGTLPVTIASKPAIETVVASGNKPSASSSASKPVTHADADSVPATMRAAAPKPAATPATPVRTVRPTPVPPVPVTRTIVVPQPAPAPAATTPASTSGHAYMVQVAAVSRPGDADILVSALHRKGYSASAVPGTKDSLTHVQIGPFADQKEALNTRDRLAKDGYLAIVK